MRLQRHDLGGVNGSGTFDGWTITPGVRIYPDHAMRLWGHAAARIRIVAGHASGSSVAVGRQGQAQQVAVGPL